MKRTIAYANELSKKGVFAQITCGLPTSFLMLGTLRFHNMGMLILEFEFFI